MTTVLVTGAAGLLGGSVVAAVPPGVRLLAQVRRQALPAALRARVALEQPLDLRSADEVTEFFNRHAPQAVIHTAAQSSAAACERDPAGARADNVSVPQLLARLCTEARIPLLHCSTDLVFDGLPAHAVTLAPSGPVEVLRPDGQSAVPPLAPGAPAGPPYLEEAERRPVGVYAATKVAAEDAVRACPTSLVVRLPLLLGRSPAGDRSPDEQLVSAVRHAAPVRLFVDEYRTPIHVLAAARLLWELLGRGLHGVLHVAGSERVSRWELGVRLAARLGLPTASFQRASQRDFSGSPPRCPDESLDTRRLAALLGRPAPSLEESLNLPLAGTPWE